MRDIICHYHIASICFGALIGLAYRISEADVDGRDDRQNGEGNICFHLVLFCFNWSFKELAMIDHSIVREYLTMLSNFVHRRVDLFYDLECRLRSC